MEAAQFAGCGMISIGEALVRAGLAKGEPWAARLWSEEDPWNVIFQGCESPIERLMCLGLHGYLGYEARRGQYEGRKSLPVDKRAGGLVYGQHWIGEKYRADFLVVGFMRGEEPIRIVVECDGKEFHNPAHDRRRDEFMVGLGFKIVRFTGFEINRQLAETIGRIPAAMGARYAWTIAAEYGSAAITDMTDYLEGKEIVRAKPDFIDDDGTPCKWDDTL
jgi:very-short-patch-repair endonuclease